jgi:hypothetical protein
MPVTVTLGLSHEKRGIIEKGDYEWQVENAPAILAFLSIYCIFNFFYLIEPLKSRKS